MPIYEYKCAKCGHEIEVIQKISESHLVKCPECKKNFLEKQLSAGGIFIFKGDGFYYKGEA